MLFLLFLLLAVPLVWNTRLARQGILEPLRQDFGDQLHGFLERVAELEEGAFEEGAFEEGAFEDGDFEDGDFENSDDGWDWEKLELSPADFDEAVLEEADLEEEAFEAEEGEYLGDDPLANAFLRRYVEMIWEELEEGPEPAFARALRARLVVLDEESPDELDGDWSASVGRMARRQMRKEIPRRFHAPLELEEHSSELASDLAPEPELGEHPADSHRAENPKTYTERLSRAIREEEILLEDDVCLELRSGTGEVLLTNLAGEQEPEDLGNGIALITTGVPRDLVGILEPRQRHCLVRRMEVKEGLVLTVGGSLPDQLKALRQLAFVQNLFLVLGFLATPALAFLLAGPFERFRREVGDACERVGKGELDVRLKNRWDGADLDAVGSEINRMLAQLQSSVESVAHVSDNIAHDLRTPLTRLQAQLELLKQSSHRGDELVAAVQDEADQLVATFNALLRIAQVESGRQRREFRRFNLARVLSDVEELYAPAFVEGGLELRCEIPGVEVTAFGDPDLWMQALSNLLDNALKYTPSGGHAVLRLVPSGEGLLIELVDSGPGIPEAEQENVLRRFYRLRQHRSSRGSGLGLSLVAAICQLHDASLRFDNEGGLAVRIQIPHR